MLQDLKMYFLYRQVTLAQAEKVLLKDNFNQVPTVPTVLSPIA
jgi:hypothetical protein